MRIWSTPTVLTFASLCGCTGPEGVWMITLESAGAPETTSTVTHNYTNATVPSPDGTAGDWTVTAEQDQSGRVLFAEILLLGGDDEAVLVLDGEAYPGSASEGGWTFRWDASESALEVQTHASGYAYTEDQQATYTTRFTLEIDGDAATGVLVEDAAAEVTYLESDSWQGNETGLYAGQSPTYLYLEGQATNYADTAECDAEPCSLVVTDTYTRTTPLTAQRARYTDKDTYVGVQDAGQDYGTP